MGTRGPWSVSLVGGSRDGVTVHLFGLWFLRGLREGGWSSFRTFKVEVLSGRDLVLGVGRMSRVWESEKN